jgi:hypothetical protein
LGDDSLWEMNNKKNVEKMKIKIFSQTYRKLHRQEKSGKKKR